jgi:hypothetical protein
MKGQALVASLLANHVLNSPMDGVLQVCNGEGIVLAQNDDARGLDPLLVYTAPRDGTYLVRTFAFPAEPNSSIAFAGGENFVYRLTITTGAFVDFALPLAVCGDESTELRLFGSNLPSESLVFADPGVQTDRAFVLPPQSAAALELPLTRQTLVVAAADSAPDSPQAVEAPAMISGAIESLGDVDAFRFAATKGQKFSLRVESRSLGFEMDPIVQVADGQQKVLAEADDSDRQRDPVLAFTAPDDGEFHAIVRDVHFHGGPRHAYRLVIEEEIPDYRLTLAADSFTLTPGKPLEIPVTIERRNGFAAEIEISPQDLPAGVTAVPVKSLPAGDTAKSVKLVLTAEAGAAGAPFSIRGRSGDDANLDRTARFTIPGLTSTHTQAWLTVPKN